VWEVIKGKVWLLRGSGTRMEFRDGGFWHCRPGCCELQVGSAL
jgi:hypothetical protein